MSKIWVDPPSGWKYGFPKIWDSEQDGSMREWMLKCGYPQREIDSCGEHFYIRQWEAKDGES
jgi:hypothetical protein